MASEIRIIHGDCTVELGKLEAESIDACVTDPPYEIAFMSAKWDNTGVAFRPDTWREVMRVLKPGGYLLAFGGTRTYHRLACAIEDAGFELRDAVMWHYGCLDDQTLAVTPRGLLPYHALVVGEPVLSYDAESGTYQWDSVQDVFVYDIEDTVYRISTDFGEQVVSRNHRCLVERSGVEEFGIAEEVARERQARVPILEDLSTLLEDISDPYKRASYEEPDVLRRVFCSGEEKWMSCTSERATQGQVPSLVRSVRKNFLAKYEVDSPRGHPHVFEKVQRGCSRGRVEEAFAQRTRGLDREQSRVVLDEDDGTEESRVEGGRDLSESEGELRDCAVRQVLLGFSEHGSQGRVRDGASIGGCSGHGEVTDAQRVRAPHRSLPAAQRGRELDAVRDEPRSQVVRARGGHRTVVGRFTPERYRGIVWCVRVRTGAFVAVRNGMAFPTGNSGFPKSHNVAKAIDRALGVEPEVVGHAKYRDIRNGHGRGQGDGINAASRDGPEYLQHAITEPVTDAAKRWRGWGTALKPATEIIALARKPLSEGTVAENVMYHGTGAINVDACRIPAGAGDEPMTADRVPGNRSREHYRTGVPINLRPSAFGRWPANVAHDGSEEVVKAFPNAPGQQYVTGPEYGDKPGTYGGYGPSPRHAPRGDRGSAARFFYTAKAGKFDRAGSKHPTVKPVDLMRWLVRMVTPPGGTVIDPFSGSGSTLVAARDENFNAVGIEQSAEFIADIRWRLQQFDPESPFVDPRAAPRGLFADDDD